MIALERWADLWAPLMVTVIWQAALLAVLALACERALRIRAPQARHRLWWLVLAAPLLLAPARLALERHAATVAVPTPAPVTRAVGFTRSLFPPAPPPGSGEMPSPRPPAVPPMPARNLQLSAGAVLLLAWLLGCAVVGGRLVLGHRSLRKLLAASEPVTEDPARDLLEELRRDADVKQEIALHSATGLSAPLLYGLRRPTILMPREWLDSLSPEDLRVVLAHEVAHIRRRDVLGNLLQRLAELPLFFHPTTWLAGRRIMLAREELCDAQALGDTADPRVYALSLLSVAEKTRGAVALASVGVAEGRFTLLRRVEAIMAHQSGRRLSRTAGAALGVFILAAVVASAAVKVHSGVHATQARSVAPSASLQAAALAVAERRADELEEAQQVYNNMKQIALALQMYMVDHDERLPDTNNTAAVMEILREYMKSQDVFMRPGTSEPVVRFTFPPGLLTTSVAAPAQFVIAVVDYDPGWKVEAYLDGHAVKLEKGAPAPPPPPARGGLEAGSPLVLPLLNLWRYGPDPLVAGTSWTYDMMGQPLGMRIVEAEPNADGTATVLTVDLSYRGSTQRARVLLPRDRKSITVSTGSEDSFRTFDLVIPLLRPGAKWRPLGEEEGTVTSTEQLPLTTPAGGFPNAAKVTVSFGEPLGDAAFWFAPGIGLVAAEETHGRHTTKAAELTEYLPAESGYERVEPQQLPPGMKPEDLRGVAGYMLLTLSPYGPSELRPGATWTYRAFGSDALCRLRVVEVAPAPQATKSVVAADLTLFGTTKRVEVTVSADRRLLVARPAPPSRGPTLTLTMPELKAGDRWPFVGMDELSVRAVESSALSTPAGHFPDAVRIALGSTREEAVLWFAPGIGLAAVDSLGRRILELTSYQPGEAGR